jgi:hypothetical protein
MRYVWIDNKPYEWKEILRLRRQQIEAERRAQQPRLFELRDDLRPASQQTGVDAMRSPRCLMWTEMSTPLPRAARGRLTSRRATSGGSFYSPASRI